MTELVDVLIDVVLLVVLLVEVVVVDVDVADADADGVNVLRCTPSAKRFYMRWKREVVRQHNQNKDTSRDMHALVINTTFLLAGEHSQIDWSQSLRQVDSLWSSTRVTWLDFHWSRGTSRSHHGNMRHHYHNTSCHRCTAWLLVGGRLQ